MRQIQADEFGECRNLGHDVDILRMPWCLDFDELDRSASSACRTVAATAATATCVEDSRGLSRQVRCFAITPRKTNECPLKINGWKMYFLLKWPLGAKELPAGFDQHILADVFFGCLLKIFLSTFNVRLRSAFNGISQAWNGQINQVQWWRFSGPEAKCEQRNKQVSSIKETYSQWLFLVPVKGGR